MSSFPCLARFVSDSGQVRYRLGDRLVDRYLEFVAGRCWLKALGLLCRISAEWPVLDRLVPFIGPEPGVDVRPGNHHSGSPSAAGAVDSVSVPLPGSCPTSLLGLAG